MASRRTRISAALVITLATCGCASGRQLSEPTFPFAYQRTFDYGGPGGSDVMMFVYDEQARASAIARRDRMNVEAGSYDGIEFCSVGAYCIRIGELDGPLVVTAAPTDAFEADGWRVNVTRDVMARSTCDAYSALRAEQRIEYTHCQGIGVTRIATFNGSTMMREYELRSFHGLAASLNRR